MTTLFTLSIITVAVAFCNYKHSEIMKTHNDAINSYYQNRMLEQAKVYRRISISLMIIAGVIALVSLFNLLESRNTTQPTSQYYDTRN